MERYNRMVEDMAQKVGIEIKAASLNSYYTIRKRLQAFIGEKYHTTDISFGQMEEDFLDCLQHYSVGKLRHSQGYYRKMALAVKKACRLAYHEGLTERQLFAHIQIERGENKQPRALDRASLDKLQTLTFEPYEVKLETARNLFLFSCFTGVAYCDMLVLNREHLFTDDKGAWWLKFRRQKTDTLCRVKLLSEAVRLIGRYQSEERSTLFAPIAYSAYVPHYWSVKRGETTDKKTNQRLQTFREEIEQGYNTLLYKYGAVSAELLKNHLQGIGRIPTTLLALSAEELKAQRESKSEGTYSNNRSSDRQLNTFVRSRGEEDILLTAITIDFFDDYHFHLKKEGYAPATINRHLCWLSRLMYRAVNQGTIRFNPFEEVKYEAVERKPRFLSKGDVAKFLAFPLQDEGAELSRRMFLFSVFTGLAFADLQSLRVSQIETNSEGKQYIRKSRQKTEVESLIPLHPIAEQILSLYTKENSKGDYKIFPDTMSKGKLLTHLKTVSLACGVRTPLGYHVGRHSFGTQTLEAGIPIESIAKMMGHSSIASTQIYAQITNQKIARDMEKLTQKRRG